jgi:hypothetical protein
MTPAQREALDAYEQHGSQRKAAAALGISKSAMQQRLVAAERWLNAPEGQKAAIEASGLNISAAKHGWRVVQHDDGSRDSVFWKADEQEQQDMLERIKEAFEDLPAADPIPAPAHKAKDLLTLYPIADAHIGMLAWAAETGEDYDTNKATQRLINWLGQAVEASAPSETAIILDVGDLTHADDHTNQTPESKHVLDVDSRHYRTIDVTISTLVTATKLALKKHKRVIVRILPGNHNRESYIAIMFALFEHFRNEPRVEVEKQPGKYFTYQFGKNMICAHHGDGVKAERLVNYLADTYAPIWGQTQHRFLWTGHLHHHKSADIGGMQWEQLRALTAKDAYSVGHAYCARAQLQAVTYHKEKGEVGRVKVAA